MARSDGSKTLPLGLEVTELPLKVETEFELAPIGREVRCSFAPGLDRECDVRWRHGLVDTPHHIDCCECRELGPVVPGTSRRRRGRRTSEGGVEADSNGLAQWPRNWCHPVRQRYRSRIV